MLSDDIHPSGVASSPDLALAGVGAVTPHSSNGGSGFERFHSVLSILSYLIKAPLVPDGTPVVNALSAQVCVRVYGLLPNLGLNCSLVVVFLVFHQRQAIVNIFRACVGLPPDDCMLLEHRLPSLVETCRSNTGKFKKISGALIISCR